MKTKTVRKPMIIICAVVLICALSIAGSLAYLHSITDKVVNTFTVGKVSITLDEQILDDDGKPTSERGVKGNTYDIVPGKQYVKDPIVHVQAESADCYVRVFVTVNNLSAVRSSLIPAYCTEKSVDPSTSKTNAFVEKFAKEFMNVTGDWTFKGYTSDASADTCTLEYRYNNVVAKSASDQDLKVFDTFTVPGWISDTELDAIEDDVKVSVVGNAIQSETFANADAAWAKF